MKKFVAVIIAGCLIAGAVSCGGQESESTRTRNAGEVKEAFRGGGAGLLISLATNALTMIPGMPKELTALLGGSADNAAEFAAISAALEQIQQTLAVMDNKLNQIKADLVKIQGQITDVQSALTGLITLYGNEQCKNELEATKRALQPTLAVVDDNYSKLYGPSGVIPNVINDWRVYLQNQIDGLSPSAPDYSIESSALATVYAELNGSPNFQTALSVLTTNVVHGPEGVGATTGVILKMMQCTVGMEASQKRFLTHDDSVRWKALGDYYELEAKKALILSSFTTTYQPEGKSRTPDFISFNQKIAQYLSLQKNINLMTGKLIPVGQVFDYKTGRMWTRGLATSDARTKTQVTSASGYTTMYKAMRSCVQSGDLVMDNKAYETDSGGRTTTSTLSRCLMADPKLDTRPATVSEWRLPEVSEIVSPGKGGLTPISSTNVGLIDDWGSADLCGTPRTRCVSPTQFLKAQGATSLIPANEDTSFVWTNTSQASQLVASNTGTADERARYQAIKDKLNDRFMENQTSPDDTSTQSIDVGANTQCVWRGTIFWWDCNPIAWDVAQNSNNATCVFPDEKPSWQTPTPPPFPNSLLSTRRTDCLTESAPPSYYQNGTALRTWQWSQCDALLENKPSTLRYASVHVVNLGTSQSPLMKEEGGRDMNRSAVLPAAAGPFGGGAGTLPTTSYKSVTINGKYAPTPAGMVATFFGGGAINRAYPGTMSDRVVMCVNRTGALWYTVDFDSPLAQMANTILVRNLFPNERYFFKDLDAYRTAFPNGPIQTVFSVITPQTTAANPDAKTYISTTSQSSDVKCVVDPVEAPTDYRTLAPIKTTGNACAFAYFDLAPGPHTVYAAAGDGSFFTEDITVPTVELAQMNDFTVNSDNGTVTVQIVPDKMNSKYTYSCRTSPTVIFAFNRSGSCTVTGLQNRQSYQVQVVTSYGTSSSTSQAKTATPFSMDSIVPTATILARGNESITLKLGDGQISSAKLVEIDRYEIYGFSETYDATTNLLLPSPVPTPSLDQCLAAQAQSCVITGLEGGVRYHAYAIAYAGQKASAASAYLDFDAVSLPATPDGVHVSAANGRINVSWNTKPETDINRPSRYTVRATPSQGAALQCSSIEGACIIAGADGETRYSISVAATNDAGNSDGSAAITAIPRFKPGVPFGTALIRDSKVSVTVTPGSVAAGQSGTTNSIVVTSSPGAFTCVIPTSETKCEMTDLLRDVEYTFSAAAQNETGISESSQPFGRVIVYSAPSQPVISSGIGVNSSISVVINAMTNVDSYRLTASTPGAPDVTTICPIQCVIPGLNNNVPYTVTARAINNGGMSGPSIPFGPLIPVDAPAKPGMPTVKLGVRAATITIKTNPDRSITKYMVKSVGDDKSCEISVPASKCTISDLIVGEIYSFTVTAVNRSGMSVQSSETPGLVPLAVPLSPTNLLITSNGEDVVVSVIADPKSESVDEFVVTLSPQNYSCSVDPLKRVCIIKNVARNIKYTFSAVSVNSGGESRPLVEEYFHPPAPNAPSNLSITPSPSSLVINFDINSMNSSTKSVKMVLSPGGKSCTVTLPSSNCEIDVDTTQSYTVAATSYSADGESSVNTVRSLSKTFLESTKVDLVVPATGTTVAPNLTLSLKKAVSAKWVAAYAKIKVALTSTVLLSVSAGSALYCKVSGTSLKGLKVGSCKVTVSVSPKKGKAISKTVTIKVSK